MYQMHQNHQSNFSACGEYACGESVYGEPTIMNLFGEWSTRPLEL